MLLKKCPDTKKRTMSMALSGGVPTKSPKLAHAAISKAPQANNDKLDAINFMDFIPIENNADDFDLSDILTKIENNTDKTNQIVALQPSNAIQPNSFTQNVTHNQGIPFLPRNVFHNSNVTINYNIK